MRFICHLCSKNVQSLSFLIQNNAFLLVSADTKACGALLSATSVAIVIIPNLGGLFNEIPTFFKKFTAEIAENAENSIILNRGLRGFSRIYLTSRQGS